MKNILITLLLLFTFTLSGQNTKVTNGMTSSQVVTTINNNFFYYQNLFGGYFIDTLKTSDPLYQHYLNLNFSDLSTLCSVTTGTIYHGMRGSTIRTIINNNFDLINASTYHQNILALDAALVMDADATAFLSVAGTHGYTIKNCINEHVKTLKDSSLWTNALALYPLVGISADNHKWNLKDPRNLDAAYRLTYSTSTDIFPVHSEYGLYSPSYAMANTHLIPSDVLSIDSKTIFGYIQQTVIKNSIIGSGRGAPLYGADGIQIGKLGTHFTLGGLISGNVTYPSMQLGGFWGATRVDDANINLYHNDLLWDSVEEEPTYNSEFAYAIGSIPFDGAESVNYVSSTTISYAGVYPGLTEENINRLSNIIEEFQVCMVRSVNTSFPPTEYSATVSKINVQANAGDEVKIEFRGKTSLSSTLPKIYWGNGLVAELLCDSTFFELSNVYANSGNYTITITNTNAIDGIRILGEVDNDCMYGDTAFINHLPNITYLHISSATRNANYWTGDLEGCPELRYLYFSAFVFYSGDIATFTHLVEYYPGNSIFLHGDLSNLVNMTNYYGGQNTTVYGNTDLLTKLRQLEIGSTSAPGLSGDIMSDSLNIICFGGANTLNYDVTNKYRLGYLSITPDNTIHGSITNDTMLYYLGAGGNAAFDLTGSIANLKNLCYVTNGFFDKPTRFINNPQLCWFSPGVVDWVFTSEEINQLLADLWANRDVFRNPIQSLYPTIYWGGTAGVGWTRYINLTGAVGSQPPTGQGLIDLANLRNYETPPSFGDDPRNKWTIVVPGGL